MVTLLVAAGIVRVGRGGQRVQHRADHLRALRRQVPVQHPGALERGLQLERPVLEVLVIGVLIRDWGPGPGVDLRGQPGQPRQVQPPARRCQEDLLCGRAAVLREPGGPGADHPGVRFGDGPGGQRLRDQRVLGGAPDPGGVRDGGALGDPGLVDQPGGGAVVAVVAVALPGGERAQQRGPGGGADRVGLLQGQQAPGLFLGGQLGGIRRGQERQPGPDHRGGLGRAGYCREYGHRDVTSLRPGWQSSFLVR